MINLLESGLVYRNPKPYLRAINAWHPTLVDLGDGELLCSFDLGEGAESLDYRTHLARSYDNGRTWSAPQPIMDDPVQPSTHTMRPRRLRDGSIVAIGTRFHRADPEEGIFNRATNGSVPMDIFLLRSTDNGASWSGPRTINIPLKGLAYEPCHSIVELADGRWLWPTSTLPEWDGRVPEGIKAVAFVSHDRGETWPEYLDELQAEGTMFLEQSLVQLPDGRLLALAWAFQVSSGTSRPNVFALSNDGVKFGPAYPAGINGETAKLLPLGGNEVLCVYRRADQPGLWGARATVFEERWEIHEGAPLWQGAASGMTGVGSNSDNLSNLKFGYPNLLRLADGNALIAFWCCEDAVYNIRWLRVKLS